MTREEIEEVLRGWLIPDDWKTAIANDLIKSILIPLAKEAFEAGGTHVYHPIDSPNCAEWIESKFGEQIKE